MKKMSLNEIRKRFLDFFESKDHYVEASFPLIPQNDKSLLLINSGMAPLKNYFMGVETPPANRMSTCQKCLRTGDIENVGFTARHATFFEMLGNFSFGDYFKEQSLLWGWEFITKDLELSTEKLWATVYLEDDEAYAIWRDVIKLPEDKIVRLGKKDNFWEIGVGPCGPCSEIYFDRGEKYGCSDPNCKPGCDCDRYTEFWNHVFTQYDRDEVGNYSELAKKNIDTGMGLERIACIVQEVDSIYEIDTNQHILHSVAAKSGRKYGDSHKFDISMRIVTDHIKAVTFLVCDGVLPNNEGRGYVLRRLLRRAARHGKLLGIDGIFLIDFVDSVIQMYGEAYPDLIERQDYIKKIIALEEERFQQTIDKGLHILNGYMDELEKAGEKELDGKKAFILYGTYGFPYDLTVEILSERNLQLNEAAYKKALEEDKELARSARGSGDDLGWEADALADLGITEATVFTGYDHLTEEALVLAIVKDAEAVESASKGDMVNVILNKTAFYPEGGGQAGDVGELQAHGVVVEISDTKKGHNGLIIHTGKVLEGTLACGNKVMAVVDEDERLDAARNHTATHLLQKSLRKVLGDHVEQSGSSVDAERLRFDFTHFQGITEDELTRIEAMVNEQIYSPMAVETMNTSIDEARKMGAMALFGEKYGSTVRVVKMGDFSLELCGGTHLQNTAQIGMFKIVSEGGVASGVRRIEAITGREVYAYLKGLEGKVEKVADTLKSTVQDIEVKAEAVMADFKSVSRELESLKSKAALNASKELIENANIIKGVKLVATRLDGADIDTLKMLGDSIKERTQNVVTVLASEVEGKALFLVMCDDEAVAAGAHAGNLVRELAKIADGGGGGKPNMAQAGGKNPAKIAEALNKSIEFLDGMLK